MVKAYLSRGIFCVLLVFISISAQSQENFPEGPGRDAIFVSCTQCHGLDRFTRVSLNAEEWENAIYDMMARGAVVDIKDLENVRKYLVENFAVER
jgi:hypothetical protein